MEGDCTVAAPADSASSGTEPAVWRRAAGGRTRTTGKATTRPILAREGAGAPLDPHRPRATFSGGHARQDLRTLGELRDRDVAPARAARPRLRPLRRDPPRRRARPARVHRDARRDGVAAVPVRRGAAGGV